MDQTRKNIPVISYIYMHTIRVIVHDRVQLKEKALGKKTKVWGWGRKRWHNKLNFPFSTPKIPWKRKEYS
jgi:hypothetical protein